MAQRWTQGEQLQKDRDLLRLLDIETAKLTASEINLAAEGLT